MSNINRVPGTISSSAGRGGESKVSPRLALRALSAMFAASALAACGGSEASDPRCLNSRCGDSGAEVQPEAAGTGGGVDAGSAEVADASGAETVDTGTGDAARKVSLNCKPVPSGSSFKAYVAADGVPPRTEYTAGTTVSGATAKITMLTDGGVQCENVNKNGVTISIVKCEKVAPTADDCVVYSVGSPTDDPANKTKCASSTASALVASPLKGACVDVWKAGKQVFVAETK